MSTASDGADEELFVFVRFHALPEREAEVEALLHEVIAPTRAEPGNVSIRAFRASRDAREFYIHSHWRDESAFDVHSGLPHTVQFVASIRALIDHELHVSRTFRIV